ncbi:MAG: MerR family transcriptional regulator [Chloroflexota bacterium]
MFDTGKFSRMARVSKRTLRYYDSIDLFKQLKVDPDTAIRYYSAEQFADLNRIVSLKELGLTLEQIHKMLADDISTEEIHGMLLIKKAETEQRLLGDIQRLRIIESRLKNPEHFLTQGVVLKPIPQQTILSYRNTFHNEDLIPLYRNVMSQVPKRVGANDVSFFVALMHSEEFDNENIDAEVGYLMPKSLDLEVPLFEELILRERILPGVDEMASVILVGGPDRYPAGFEAVTRWCEANGYDIHTPERHICLEMPANENPEEMVVELQFPVERVLTDPKSLLTNRELL